MPQYNLIPKIIHQIWIGNNPIPDNCKKYMDKVKEIHEKLGYTYYFWGNELYDKYKDDEFTQNYRKKQLPNAYISDRFRLLLLRDYGGIYIDVDAEMIKDFDFVLDKLHCNTTFFAGIRKLIDKNALIDCTVFGSAPNSRIVQRCLDTYTNINWANGGKMFSDKIIQEIDNDVVIFNYKYFYDIKITENTVFLHDTHQLSSWRKKKITKIFL